MLFGVASRAYAGCESAILQGGHTAVKKTEAVKLALSEVRDACYPGCVMPAIRGRSLYCRRTADKSIQAWRTLQ